MLTYIYLINIINHTLLYLLAMESTYLYLGLIFFTTNFCTYIIIDDIDCAVLPGLFSIFLTPHSPFISLYISIPYPLYHHMSITIQIPETALCCYSSTNTLETLLNAESVLFIFHQIHTPYILSQYKLWSGESLSAWPHLQTSLLYYTLQNTPNLHIYSGAARS